jgi:ADP-ribosylglycohydrolase
MVRGVHQLGKAHEQLLLASELTHDVERAERLAALAHSVGELVDGDTDTDADELDEIEQSLTDIREDAHDEVRDAIVRAQEVLAAARAPVPA